MKTKKLSLLTKRSVESALVIAKANLGASGDFMPIIFFKTDKMADQIGLAPVIFPMADIDSDGKRLFLAKMGAEMSKEVGELQEAIFITDSFYLEADKSKGRTDLKTPIHDNPLRKEALTVIGRDKSRKRQIFGQLPYERVGGKIIFGRLMVDTKFEGVGLIDYLFDVGQARLLERVAYAKENKSDKN